MIYRSMTRMLIVAGLVLMVVSVFGCATIDAAYDNARWQWSGFETGRYVWIEKDRDTITASCGLSDSRAYGGCAYRLTDPVDVPNSKPIPGRRVTTGMCLVLADVSEEDAKRLASRDGDSLFDHELRHCLGWVHPTQRRY